MKSAESKKTGKLNDGEYQELLNNLEDGVFIVAENQIVHYNCPLLDTLRMSPKQVTLKKLVERLGTTGNETARGSLKRLLTGKPFGPIEFEVAFDEATQLNLEITCRKFTYQSQPALLVIVKDRTREFAVEGELFDTLSLLNSVFDAIAEAIFILDTTNFTLQSSNISAARMFKIDRAVCKGKTLWHLIANPSQVNDLVAQIQSKLDSDGLFHFECEMQRGDGVAFPALHTISKVKDNRGKMIGLMWIVSDMTKQTFLNRALAEVETRYRILFDRAADPTFIVDVETKQIIDANKAAFEQLGYGRSELIGRTMFDTTPASRHKLMREDFEKLLLKKFSTFQGMNLAKDGKQVPVQISAVMTTFGSRRVFIVASRDISQQLEIQRERVRIEKLETVRQVAGGIAHEFSQPLQGLISIAEILDDQSTNLETYRTLVPKIPPLVDRMNLLLNQMKRIVRLAIKPYVNKDGIVDLGRSTQVPRMLILDPKGDFEQEALRAAMVRGIEPEATRDYDVARKKLDNGDFELLMYDDGNSDMRLKPFLQKVNQHVPKILQVKVLRAGDKSAPLSETEIISSLDKALTNQ